MKSSDVVVERKLNSFIDLIKMFKTVAMFFRMYDIDIFPVSVYLSHVNVCSTGNGKAAFMPFGFNFRGQPIQLFPADPIFFSISADNHM